MKKRLSLFLILCMCTCTMFGCGKESKDKEKETTKVSTEANTVTSDDEEIYEQLFNLSNTVSVQIEISDEELDKLQNDYKKYDTMNSKSPIYRMADKVIISIGDEVYEIEEVGIRLKGNTSRVPVYDTNTGKPNLSHYRLSFNETFDDEEYYGEDSKVWSSDEEREARKDRRFATLKGMEVKWNKNYDDTHVRELYAYEIFRDMGVLAQQVNVCSLGVNGENYGLVNIYEPVDQIFIERNLPEKDWGGDLYKCGWTYKPANYVESTVTYGIDDPDSAKVYNYDLKTNKKDSTYDTLKNLLETMSNPDISKEDFEKVVDTDNFANFLAASYFTGNPDDMRNNYNNHYVYFLKSSGKAIFIPYDYDRCLGITYHWNPDGTGMTYVSPYSEDSESNGRKQTNPLINAAIINDNAYCIEAYNTALKKIADGVWLKEDNFEEYYETVKQNYEEVVTPTLDFDNAEETNFKFSLDGIDNGDDSANMSFKQYVDGILESYNKEVQ